MAETLLSPGVLARENDQSFIQGQPVEVGAAIIGPTTKGPVEIPTIVGSFGEFTQIFGGAVESGSTTYSYLTSISANNYFQNGGNSLLVTRVTSGSFTPASSSLIATGSGGPTTGESPFVLETISEGEIMNTGTTELSNGALETGSADNVRFEIASVNTSSGTFSLLIRRGDDNQNQKVVLESYNNISLDPYASNYISKVIGDIDNTLRSDGTDYYIQESGSYSNISKYVRVKEVNFKTPKYFDNTGAAKDAFTGSLPVVQSGSFGGANGSNIPVGRPANFYNNIDNNDIQGLLGSDYNDAIALLANTDEYKYNIITAPGLIDENVDTGGTQITSLVNNTIARGDAISVIDLVNYNSQVNNVINQASGFDSSYASTYWPWLQTIDPNTGEAVYVPASTMIPGVFAFTDASSEPWFAPAGITRGGLGQVIRAERKLTAGNRDALYEANINPIATFPQSGVVVFGQKTLQKRASALDRVNVRRLLIALKSFIGQVADNLVFEQNTIATRNNFLTQVNPYLESVQQRQGLYAFKVVMDDTNNTADVIDRNELVGQIFIQPTRTAEFIVLDFNVLPTGASFPA
ncbi:phage tail sheath subtilisin-like domain-containing protein [bacterium]|nr:phage tail sheath subtilisin-like domain-containing protein [bacterium]